jgi:RecA-family ATPase
MSEVVRMPQRPATTIAWLGTAEIFAELAPTPWIARGLMLGPGRPALLAGYGASAKTLAAQSMALAVASGRPIWGHFEVTDPGHVRHLDFEQGEQATRRRYQRLAIGHGIDTPELGDRLRLAALPRVYLDSNSALEVFSRELDGAQLAIIDSLRAAAPTLDENDSAVRAALDVLTAASNKTGCAVLLLHHAGKTQDRHGDARQIARGSSAIFDAAGNVLVIAQGDTKTAPRKVTQAKVPAEAEGAPIADFLLAVEDVEMFGEPAAGVRVVHREAAEDDREDPAPYDRYAPQILRVVREHAGEFSSANTLAARVKGRRTEVLQVIRAMEEAGELVKTPHADPGNGTKVYRPGVES